MEAIELQEILSMTNNAKTSPAMLLVIVPKATRLMFTAFSINSMDIRTMTPFLRARTP